jgi:hypothetical protein
LRLAAWCPTHTQTCSCGLRPAPRRARRQTGSSLAPALLRRSGGHPLATSGSRQGPRRRVAGQWLLPTGLTSGVRRGGAPEWGFAARHDAEWGLRRCPRSQDSDCSLLCLYLGLLNLAQCLELLRTGPEIYIWYRRHFGPCLGPWP